MSTSFGQDFDVEIQARSEAGVWSVVYYLCFVEVLNSMRLWGQDCEVRSGQYFEF